MFFVFPKQNAKFSPMQGVTLAVNQGSCGKQPAAAFSSPEEVQQWVSVSWLLSG